MPPLPAGRRRTGFYLSRGNPREPVRPVAAAPLGGAGICGIAPPALACHPERSEESLRLFCCGSCRGGLQPCPVPGPFALSASRRFVSRTPPRRRFLLSVGFSFLPQFQISNLRFQILLRVPLRSPQLLAPPYKKQNGPVSRPVSSPESSLLNPDSFLLRADACPEAFCRHVSAAFLFLYLSHLR